ncbi:MAG: LuxR C-terminal-related transcriptional regulator [Erythrobacter sp.]
MATNVLDLRRYSALAAGRALIHDVTIAVPADIAGAAAALARAADSHGLRLMVWHDLSTLDPMVDAAGEALDAGAFGWAAPELAPWRCRERLLRSPLLRACRAESEPFLVTRQAIRTRWPNRVIDQIALDAQARDDDPANAIVVPVHLPFGQVGAAILVGADGGEADLSAAFTRVIAALAPAIECFVRGYVMVTRDERYLPDDSLLTAREIECLNWIAHGKTDFEIGIILGCSHAGVRYHVTRACTKLGAVNRAQSVFRAAQLGLLGTPRS